LPEQPAVAVSADVVTNGKSLYAGNCRGCHGKDAMARLGGSVPDLRYASAETHAAWHGIVIGGANQAGGMPGFSSQIDIEQSEAIRNYVLSMSESLRATAAGR
jgi:quinohemoprotein ethanol dehydrogenase